MEKEIDLIAPDMIQKEVISTRKPKVLFVYDLEQEHLWRDGLWAALQLLEKEVALTRVNLQNTTVLPDGFDMILGWGGFSSSVDRAIKAYPYPAARGLCLGGYGFQSGKSPYDVVFYECEWARSWLLEQPTFSKRTHLVHAFGVNTDIYHPGVNIPRIWNYITVGAFAAWKRQVKLCEKKGPRIAVGQLQRGNMDESVEIVGTLLLDGCTVSDMVPAETLAKLYNASLTCYIPADLFGGGERALLEARACGIDVEIEPDNPKLQELMLSPVWDHHYYARQLKEGILKCM